MNISYRPDESLQYFNAKTIQDALVVADEAYPISYEKKGGAEVEAFLGVRSESGNFESIGLRCEVWALTLLLVYHSDRRGDMQTQRGITDDLRPGKYHSQVQELITGFKQRRPPKLELLEDLREIVVETFSARLVEEQVVGDDADLAERIREVMAIDYKSPSEVYRALTKKLNPTAAHHRNDWSSPRQAKKLPKPVVDLSVHWCEDSLRDHMAPPYGRRAIPALTNTDADDLATDIADRFRRSAACRSVLLAGRPHTGKKAIVVEFLRHIQEVSEGDLSLCFQLNSPGSYLPVLAVSAHSRNYFNLTSFVLAFLRRYRDVTVLDADEETEEIRSLTSYVDEIKLGSDPDMPEKGIAKMLKEITEIHESFACMFIFTDVDSIDDDSVRKVVRGHGISRLINALTSSNSESRFLLTSTGEASGDENSKWSLGLSPAPEVIKVKALAFEEVRRYLADGSYPPELSEAIDKLHESTVTGDTYEQFDGETLLATCALLQITDPEDSRPTLTAIQKFLRHNRRSPSPRTDATAVFIELFKRFERLGILRAILLVATSDDGLRDDTLKEALKDWSRMRPHESYPQSSPDVLKQMRFVSGLAGSFFLRRPTMVHYDEDEYDLHEQASEADLVWDFDAHISEHIVRTAQNKRAQAIWPTLSIDANRALARAARRRAQIKKIRSRLPVTLDPGRDASRDIQSFTALLASIPPTDIKDHTENDRQALRLLSDEVFTLSGKFDATVALRFAVYCLLRNDIDRDSRLTMVSDQDGLRLRLYLLLFFEPGERHFWHVYQLNQAELGEAECDRRARRMLRLPKDIPDHIRKGFKRQEILDILGTIALTAFHAQQEGIIEWAKRLSQRVIDEACEGLDEPAKRDQLRRDLVARAIRIDCTRIDMWIQLGGPIDGRKRTHLETLGEVRALLEKNFSAFQRVTEGMSSERSDFSKGRMEAFEDVLKVESLARLGAWMRLRAREAQLVFLTEGREGALAVYRNLTHIEHIAARYEGNDDPVVLSGRTARRYIRVLLHPDRNKGVTREEIDEARRIIEVNISRLRRFSGAERVGVLMDMARRHVAEGNLERALKVAQNAYERAFAGSISHGGKIDVLGLLCDVWLRSIRDRSDKARGGPCLELFDELDTIADYTKLMSNLSSALDYHPSRAFGRYLSALCQVERIRLDGSATRKEITEIRTIVTQALKAMKTHGEVIYETRMEDLKQRLSNAANAVTPTGRSDVSAYL